MPLTPTEAHQFEQLARQLGFGPMKIKKMIDLAGQINDRQDGPLTEPGRYKDPDGNIDFGRFFKQAYQVYVTPNIRNDVQGNVEAEAVLLIVVIFILAVILWKPVSKGIAALLADAMRQAQEDATSLFKDATGAK